MAKKKAGRKTAKKVAKAIQKVAKKVVKKAVATLVKGDKTYRLQAGDKAPAFSAPATSGKTLSLGDFQGKGLILYFYPKDNTPGCTLESQEFTRLIAQFRALKCEVIGVSKDSVRSHESFKTKCAIRLELLADEDGTICKAFDVIQMKSLYGRQYEGIERSTFFIDESGLVRGEWRKVKVNGHAAEVLEFVRQQRKL